MQFDNNDIDKKLRQLENQSLPDLTNMDEHWQQFKSLVQPAAKPLHPRRLIRWILAAGIIAAMVVAIYQFRITGKSKTQNISQVYTNPSTEQKDTSPVVLLTNGKDTIIARAQPDGTASSTEWRFLEPGDDRGKMPKTATPIFLDTMKNNFPPIALFLKDRNGRDSGLAVMAVPIGKNTHDTTRVVWITTVNNGRYDTVRTISVRPVNNGRYDTTRVISVKSVNSGRYDTGRVISVKSVSNSRYDNGRVVSVRSVNSGRYDTGRIVTLVPVQKTKPDTSRTIINTITPSVKDDRLLLENFFRKLENPAQQFLIDNRRDTLLKGKDGTTLFISANSLKKNASVTIYLKEFYTDEDMISNRLHTTSDGKLLITGGMLEVKAYAGTQELTRTEGAVWVNMPGRQFDDRMQLFLPAASDITKLSRDTANTDYLNNNSINWQLASQFQNFENVYLVRVLDLRNTYASLEGESEIAVYFIAKKCPLSNKEVKQELQNRYGHLYEKIKVRRLWFGNKKRILFTRKYRPVIGDSVSISFQEAVKFKLISRQDSLRVIEKMKANDRYRANIARLENKYNFKLSQLGWINCDRFYNDPRPKIDFYVDLGEPASNYQTMLVFENINSLMQGYTIGNKALFQNVPDGVRARIVSVGVRDGNIISAMERVELSKKGFDNLSFEPTDTEKFKDGLKGIGN